MKTFPIFLECLSILFLLHCAHMEAPSGGPKDETPPQLSGIFPAPGSVNVPLKLEVKLEFTEWIQRSWVNLPFISQVTLSPALARKLIFKVKENSIYITSNSSLQPNTTYILSVNNSISDLNNQRLKKNFHLISRNLKVTFFFFAILANLEVSRNL